MKRRAVLPATVFVSVVLHAGFFVTPWSERGESGFQNRYEIRFESSGGGAVPERVRQRPVRQDPAPAPPEAAPAETIRSEPTNQPTNEPANETQPVRSTLAENADDGQRSHAEESRRSGKGEASRLEEYLSRVKASVEGNKFYPTFAKQLKLQGTVTLRVSISSAGRITGLSVIASSGHQSIDRAAEKAVRSSAPFDPPARFGLPDITLDIPVTYKLT
jgi:protein TonB